MSSLPRRPRIASDMPPSPTATTSPSARLSSTSPALTPIRFSELLGVVEPGARRSSAPVSSTTPRLGNGELRIFGPGRSGRIPICGAIFRIRRISPIASVMLPCANETRATSIPAPTRAAIVSGLLEAGPIVATMRVRRRSRRGRRARATTSSRNGSETKLRRDRGASRRVLEDFTTSACLTPESTADLPAWPARAATTSS